MSAPLRGSRREMGERPGTFRNARTTGHDTPVRGPESAGSALVPDRAVAW
ncbi:MAG: hypothetical protein WCR20_17170 [Verrucomicrobiota bacterium]